jgi:hypothetical protein
MSIWQIFMLLLIAGICGSLGQAIVGRSSRGCLVSISADQLEGRRTLSPD